MRRRWLIRDVCTRRRRAGHPPAVVLDAEGRTGTGLQGIACACPLAETGGVLPLQARNEHSCHTVPHAAFTVLRGLLKTAKGPTLPTMSPGLYEKTP